MKHAWNYDEELKRVSEEITLEVFDKAGETHEFSERYLERKKKLLEQVKEENSMFIEKENVMYSTSKRVKTKKRITFKKWMVAAAAFALIGTMTVGVLAATGFFRKMTNQADDVTIYKFDINYELTPGEFEIIAGYVPAGYIRDEEDLSRKYKADATKWISANINGTYALEWQGGEIRTRATLIENTMISGMEADILSLDLGENSQNLIFLFNPNEGYVVEINGGEETPLDELIKFAESMEVKRISDSEVLTPEKRAEIQGSLQNAEIAMQEYEAEIESLREKGYQESELIAIGQEGFDGLRDHNGVMDQTVGYTIKSVEFIDSITGYDENCFLNFETVKPWLNEDGSLKPYLRQKYEWVENNYNPNIIEEKMVDQTFLKVTVNAKRYKESFYGTDETLLEGMLSELQKREDGSYTWPEDDGYQPKEDQGHEMSSMFPIYFDKPQFTGGGEDRIRNFFYRDLKVGEEIEYTLLFVVDEDRKDNMVLEMGNLTPPDVKRVLHKLTETVIG